MLPQDLRFLSYGSVFFLYSGGTGYAEYGIIKI
jgi:hypothetical protein